MAGNLPIVILDKHKAVRNCSSDMEIISLELDILGEPAHFKVGVTQNQARLADIVPLARTVSRRVTDIVIERIRRSGHDVPCRTGCSACCNYLVSLSVPEAFRLREDILAMPESLRRLMQQSCYSAAQRILKQRPPKSFSSQMIPGMLEGPVELNMVANWYKNLKQSCPFHYEGTCIIYEHRPLACREHFVKGSARACSGERGTAEVIQIPVQMVCALAQLASELEGRSVEAVMMPLALVYCEENVERDKRTWPEATMVQRFVKIVEVMLEAREQMDAIGQY